MREVALAVAPEVIASGAFGMGAEELIACVFGDALLAGNSPRRATYFSLSRQRKVGKRKATPLAATLRCAAGNLRCSRPGCAAELTARLQRFVQTAAASQSTKRMHPAVHSRTPSTALLGASRGEGKTARAIAALGRWLLPLLNARGSRAHEPRAERCDGPFGLDLPSGRAEKRRAWGGRGSAACRASCSDLLRMSERRERSEQSEFRSAASRPSIAGCPQRSEGTRPVGPPFLWLLFFGETKESDCAAGRTSRPAALPRQRAREVRA